MAGLGGIFQDKSKRPRIRPERTLLDTVLWIAAINLSLTGVLYAAWWYPSLPATIPTGIGANGQPRGNGPSWTIFLMPAIGLPLVGLMLLLQRWPWISNTVVSITEENAEVQYRLVNRLLSWVAIEIGVIFLLVTIDLVNAAQGRPAAMTLVIMILSVGGTLPLLGWYFWRSFQHA